MASYTRGCLIHGKYSNLCDPGYLFIYFYFIRFIPCSSRQGRDRSLIPSKFASLGLPASEILSSVALAAQLPVCLFNGQDPTLACRHEIFLMNCGCEID